MKYKKSQSGFSLIEILVSVAVFTVVITAGTLSILSIIDANQKSQSLNSVMTNLNTALESMAREIRVGSDYTISTDNLEITFTPDQGCPSGGCLTYRYDPDLQRIDVQDTRVSGLTYVPLTAEEVHITEMNFSLLDNAVVGGASQPAVVLRVRGFAETKAKTRSDFYLQTLMSQRLLI